MIGKKVKLLSLCARQLESSPLATVSATYPGYHYPKPILRVIKMVEDATGVELRASGFPDAISKD